MAIYRLEKKSISRGSNHNLVAAVAYRAGAKLTDSNKLNPKANTHDYTKKTDVAHSEIILPDELAEQLNQAGITLDLEQVANLVEQGETTKRGKMKTSTKLASEYVLAGSHELSQDENIQAFQEFAKQQAEEQGVVTMVFVHDPKQGEDMSAGAQAADSQIYKRTHPNRKKTSDIRNIHAHVVVLSRQLVLSGDQLELGDKSDSELSDTDRKKKGLEKSKDWLKEVREQWANIQNQSLERHNLAPVTHKSYKDLGVKFRPTKHLGKDATAMERKGLQTNLGKYNESINKFNRSHLESATGRFSAATEQILDRSQQWIESIATGGSGIQRLIDRSKRGVKNSQQGIDDRKRNIAWQMGKLDRAINSTAQRTTNITEQERQVDSLIAERTAARRSTRPSPFNDEARRARADRIIEQEGRFDRRKERFDRETYRKNRTDERADIAAGRIKIAMAMVLLSRHTGMCLQPWETIEEHPEKLDARQVDLLDGFAQMIGADDKITDFSNDSIRVSKLFTADVIEQNMQVFKLLRNPKIDREMFNINSSETHTDALETSLDSSAEHNVNNDSNVPQRAFGDDISTSNQYTQFNNRRLRR